jgi:hypothetical protein
MASSSAAQTAPTLDPITDPAAILEDAGSQSVGLSGITDGDAGTQTLTVTATSNNTGLVPDPTVNYTSPASTGTLDYTPVADANGSAVITVTVTDGDGSAVETFTVAVTAVNDAPSFTKGADQATLEDAGSQNVVGWATAISAGPADEAGQTLTFNVSNDNNALFAVQPSITAGGDLSYEAVADVSGTAVVTVSLSDDGGTADGGVDTSADQTFNITVDSVNDAPSFTAGPDQSILEDAGGQGVVGWATDISAGPADESGQTLTFNVSNDNNALFTTQPSINASGDLSYEAAADANGSAVVTVSLSDDGGIDNGGQDTSADQTFNINVGAVNDAPSFTAGADEVVNEDAGAQNVAGWATAISAGPADESGQALTFNVSNDNNALFATQPSITASGDLSYEAAADTSGSATVTVSLSDDGGIADGGVDTSADQTFTITVNAVNDVPSFTGGPDQVVLEDAGSQTVVAWATDISAGPADESGQTLTFNVANDNNGLFATQPSITASGDLSYETAADANGSATVTVSLSDDGGTDNGGQDTSADQTFTITVTPVNDVPSFTAGPDQIVLEDSGAANVAWATDISAGPADESGQALTFNVSNDNNALFAVQPSISATGDLSYTPATDGNGSAIVTVSLSDDGGTLDGGVDTSADQTFSITVTAVNDEPSFTKGPDQSIIEDAGAQSVAGWATNISSGPADEAGQVLVFNVTGNTNPALFSAGPAIDATTGELTYTAADDASGSADITIELMDDGGTDNGGDDTSPSETFNISVADINDAPSFTSGGDIITETGTGEQMVPWATNVSVGPINEATQTPTFVVTANDCNPSPIVDGPTVDPDGTVRFTPVDGATGTCSISVKLTDDGGTADGGVDESPEVTISVELVTASRPVADSQSVETDDFNPLGITLTGSDPDNQTPLSFQVLEPVTDQDTGEILSDTGPFHGVLDTTTPATNPDGVSADVVYTADGPSITRAVIIAASKVTFEKGVTVQSGDVALNDSGGTLSLERDASTPAGFAIKADAINAHGTAVVGGDAFCNSGDFSANCDPLALPIYDLLPPFLTGDVDDANDVTVGNGGSASMTPGLYGDVFVGRTGTLTFAPGNYSMRSLTTGNRAVLEFSGATEVKIADYLTLGSDVDVNAGGPADEVVFYVAGAGPGTAASIDSTAFFANVYAGNGKIDIAADAIVTGSFIGQEVVVNGRASVTLDSAFSELPDQFAFEVTDQIGLVSDVAVVEINGDDFCRDDSGQLVNIAAFGGSAATDGAAFIEVTVSGCESTDVPVTFALVQDGAVGEVTGFPAGTVGPPYEVDLTYTPDNMVPNDRDSFIFSISNGISTVQATVEINEPPCASVEASTSNNSVATDENNPLTVTLSGCDPNDETLAFATDPASGGSFVDCATCAISAPVPITDNRPGFSSANVVITHNEIVSTATSFDFSATSTSGSDSSTVAVEVNPVNIAPVANDDAFAGSLGGVITGNVLDNDTDVNLDALSASLVSGPSSASNFELNPDGTFVYTHNGLANFVDGFDYSANDGSLSDTGTVSISIVAANITVSVSKAGSGATESLVTSDPAGIDCGGVCSAMFMTTEPIRLTPNAAVGFVFAFWSGDADCVDGEIIPIADRSCVANFDVDTTPPPTGDPVTITVTKTGSGSGTVTSAPAGIDCGAICSALITGDPRIALTATADAGSSFDGFAGGPGGDCEDGELEAVVNTTCSATFTALGQTLTLDFIGTGGGLVVSTPAGISCTDDCSADFETNATVTLSARPDSGDPDDVTFGGACAPDSTFPNKATVVMSADATCTVSFD